MVDMVQNIIGNPQMIILRYFSLINRGSFEENLSYSWVIHLEYDWLCNIWVGWGRVRVFNATFNNISVLPMQSVHITTKVVSSNPVHDEVYSLQHYVIKFVSDLWQVSVFLQELWFPITIIIQGDFSDFCIIFSTAPLQNSQTYQCVTLEQSKIHIGILTAITMVLLTVLKWHIGIFDCSEVTHFVCLTVLNWHTTDEIIKKINISAISKSNNIS
jgi:hypothetical protein